MASESNSSSSKQQENAKEEVFAGGCHCGAVRFEVTVSDFLVIECNCTVCWKKGMLHVYATEDQFKLISGKDDLTLYTFGTRTAKHLFCKICGIYSFYHPRSHPERFSVNLKCFDDVDAIKKFRVQKFDGRGDYEKIRSQIDDAVE